MSKVDDLLNNFICGIYENGYSTVTQHDRDLADMAFKNKIKSSLRELVMGKIPLQKMHSISHGDISHPHETPEDRIHNKIVSDISRELEEIFDGAHTKEQG